MVAGVECYVCRPKDLEILKWRKKTYLTICPSLTRPIRKKLSRPARKKKPSERFLKKNIKRAHGEAENIHILVSIGNACQNLPSEFFTNAQFHDTGLWRESWGQFFRIGICTKRRTVFGDFSLIVSVEGKPYFVCNDGVDYTIDCSTVDGMREANRLFDFFWKGYGKFMESLLAAVVMMLEN